MSDSKRPTVKDLAARVDAQDDKLSAILAAVSGSAPATTPDASPDASPAKQALLDAGFSDTDADAALVSGLPVSEPVVLTSKDQAEVLIAKGGLVPVRGRVYVDPKLVEAIVTVLKTGTPKVVQTAGEHRTKGVAVWRTDDGKSVAVQNLGVAN